MTIKMKRQQSLIFCLLSSFVHCCQLLYVMIYTSYDIQHSNHFMSKPRMKYSPSQLSHILSFFTLFKSSGLHGITVSTIVHFCPEIHRKTAEKIQGVQKISLLYILHGLSCPLIGLVDIFLIKICRYSCFQLNLETSKISINQIVIFIHIREALFFGTLGTMFNVTSEQRYVEEKTRAQKVKPSTLL